MLCFIILGKKLLCKTPGSFRTQKKEPSSEGSFRVHLRFIYDPIQL